MQNAPGSRSSLERALAPHGLRVRGGLIPNASDGLPVLHEGADAAVIWLVGQVGSECWTAFSSSPFYADGQADPMDRWAKAIGNPLAHALGGIAIYPSDGPPYHPFQRWAQRAEPVQTSPLMLQIHPEYGLWHAYRFALVLPALLDQDARDIRQFPELPSPGICVQCDGQPCLSACPVQAFSVSGYDVDSCATHLHRPEGQPCMQTGCQARRACPVGAQNRYAPEHAAFHMAAFANKRSEVV